MRAKKIVSSSELCLLQEGGVALLGAQAVMDQHGGVAAVVEDQVGEAAAVPIEQARGVVPVLDQRLALVGEHRDAGSGDGGGGVVLRRENVAGDPANVGAERLQRLDQHGRLDGHMQRAGDAGALQGLLGAVLGADGHEAGHLRLGEVDLLAAEGGQRDVLHDVVGGLTHERCSLRLTRPKPPRRGAGARFLPPF